jgi:8-oxo-dGTP pyrophosphatase MutT (NUDIX family)
MNFKMWFENERYSTPDEFLNDPNSVTFIYADKLYYGNQSDGIITHGDLVVNNLDLKIRYGIPPKMTNTEEVYDRLHYNQIFGTDLTGRVSLDVIEWGGSTRKRQVVSFWNDKATDYKTFDSCIDELINKGIINKDAFITSVLVGSVPIDVARQKLFGGVNVDPEEARKLDLRRRLHMMTGLEKQQAMKELGLGGNLNRAPKSGIPGVKYWAPTSENFDPKSYLSIGHGYDDVDSWVLKRRGKDILVASKMGVNPEFFHDQYQNGVDFKGRVDHNKRAISIVAEWGDEDRLEYVIKLLQASYPGYRIWLFGRGLPKLMEAAKPKVIACGDCYRYAAKLATKLPDKDALVCHGTVRDKFYKKRYGHAWVESEGKCSDWQMSGSVETPKWLDIKDYYEFYNPKNVKKYRAGMAIGNSFRSGHWGPWNETWAYRNIKQCPYWGDAGSGIIVIAKDTGKILLNHRGGGAVESGTYGVFGGGIFLHQVGMRSTEELMGSDIPKRHAIEELEEETGYSGSLENVHQIHVFKDNKINRDGEPCNFYYWTFLGVVPSEFPINVGYGFEDEEGGGSGWFTFEEAMKIHPKHPGLIDVFNHAGGKIRSVINSIRGNNEIS